MFVHLSFQMAHRKKSQGAKLGEHKAHWTSLANMIRCCGNISQNLYWLSLCVQRRPNSVETTHSDFRVWCALVPRTAASAHTVAFWPSSLKKVRAINTKIYNCTPNWPIGNEDFREADDCFPFSNKQKVLVNVARQMKVNFFTVQHIGEHCKNILEMFQSHIVSLQLLRLLQ